MKWIGLAILSMVLFVSNVMPASNQASLSFGFKHDNRGSANLLTSHSDEGIPGNFVYSLQYSILIKPDFGIGLDIGFSSLNDREKNLEQDVSGIPALINLRYYWLPGKIRPYSKIGGGALIGLTAKTKGDELHLENEYDDTKHDSKAGSEKYILKLGYAGGAFFGVDWLFFTGLGINIEAGILYEHLHDKMFTNGKLLSTSLLSRAGIFYKF